MERRGAGAAAAAAVGRRLLWALPAYAAGLLGLGAGALLLALALYAGWRRRRRARQRALSLAARLHSDEEAAVRAAAAGLGAARGELPAWVSGARGGGLPQACGSQHLRQAPSRTRVSNWVSAPWLGKSLGRASGPLGVCFPWKASQTRPWWLPAPLPWYPPCAMHFSCSPVPVVV